MKKYQEALFRNIEGQLAEWLEQGGGAVDNSDVRRFLHTITGTAGTIGLQELSDTAAGLMRQSDGAPHALWEPSELRTFLRDIASIAYRSREGEDLREPSDDAGLVHLEPDAPLVLILDDDYAFVAYLKDGLERRGYMVLNAVRSEEAVHYMHQYRPDALIVDLHLQEGNGFELLRELEDKISSLFIAVTVVSADDTKANRMEAFRLGADDFVAKPLDLEEMCERLSRQLRKKAAVDRLVVHDELTGAYRRGEAESIHQAFLEESRAGEGPFELAIVDIAGLGEINAKQGFRTGDRLLVSLSEALSSRMSRQDRLIRYGGGRFLLYFRSRGKSADTSVPDTWLRAFEADSPVPVRLLSGKMTVAGPDDGFETCLSETIRRMLASEEGRGGRGADAVIAQASGPVRAAIVDDDAVIRTMISEHVKHCFPADAATEIRVFRDGEEFMNDPWSSDNVPCFVILDRMMPRMDGIEVLQRLRQSPASKRFTVLMLTNRKSDSDIAKALELGADDYVTKPFSLKELEARIRRLIGRMVPK